MATNETAPEPPALVWIALSVDMPSCAGSEVEDYVSVPRAEWDAMTEGEREDRIREEIDAFLANSVNAGGGIVDESEVPAAYRGRFAGAAVSGTGQPYRWQDDRPLDGTEFAARLRPGTAVLNGMWEAGSPEVLNVAHVEDLTDGMVRVHDVSGFAVTVCADMCMEIVTGELADLMAALVIAEAEGS